MPSKATFVPVADPIASTASGEVRGKQTSHGVLRFTGIPYAAPPTGARRFRPPEPPVEWSGVRDARAFAANAPQNPSAIDALTGSRAHESSEDCLFLNVWTPALDDGARPVMVWIHGGGFATGSGGVPWYHGDRLAGRGDVVVVTLNYRLGVFGFLHLGELLGADFAGSGNLGLLDQIAALRWVRDNIAGFGGDPNRVTIFGESAGGMSVACLLAAPAAEGLFHRAIAQSGAAHHVSTTERAHGVALDLLAGLGVSSDQPEALLDAGVEDLLRSQDALAQARTTAALRRAVPPLEAGSLPFQPVVDGVVLPQRPLDAIAAGSAAETPLITGTTREEWRLFHAASGASMDEARLAAAAGWLFGADRGHDVIAAYRATDPDASASDVYVALASDWVFRIPALRLAEVHARAARAPSTFVYEFDYASRAFGGLLGACHIVDVPFVLDNLDRGGVDLFLGGLDDAAHRLAAATSGAWLAFARTGDPSHEGLPPWTPYDPDHRTTMILAAGGCEIVENPRSAERALWDGVI
jgi:para-nitrobenzyl esterase